MERQASQHENHSLSGAAMSVQAIGWVLDHSKSRLAARHVLISIANHAKSDGTGAWPSVGTIARESRISKREVQRSIPQLVALGELHVEPGAGPNGTHMYSLPKMRGDKLAGEEATNGHRGVTSCHGEGVTNGRVPPDQKSPEPSLKKTVLEEKSIPAPQKAAARTQEPPAGFLRFWQAYPRKIDKQDALGAWSKHGLEKEADQILAALAPWKACDQWQDEKFIPHAATFLNKHRWESKPPAMTMKGGTDNGHNHVRASNIEVTLRGYEQLQAGAHR